MATKRYPSDQTDAQWEIIKALLKKKRGAGRPTTTDLRRQPVTLLPPFRRLVLVGRQRRLPDGGTPLTSMNRSSSTAVVPLFLKNAWAQARRFSTVARAHHVRPAMSDHHLASSKMFDPGI